MEFMDALRLEWSTIPDDFFEVLQSVNEQTAKLNSLDKLAKLKYGEDINVRVLTMKADVETLKGIMDLMVQFFPSESQTLNWAHNVALTMKETCGRFPTLEEIMVVGYEQLVNATA